MTDRACTSCGVVQPHHAYPVRHGYHIGRCLDCERASRRAWKAAHPTPGDKTMIAFDSLTPDRWTVVARWVSVDAHTDGWKWVLSPQDVSVLQIAVAHGSVRIHQKRDDCGQMVKVAKLARVQREGLAFAIAGAGMFDQ